MIVHLTGESELSLDTEASVVVLSTASTSWETVLLPRNFLLNLKTLLPKLSESWLVDSELDEVAIALTDGIAIVLFASSGFEESVSSAALWTWHGVLVDCPSVRSDSGLETPRRLLEQNKEIMCYVLYKL